MASFHKIVLEGSADLTVKVGPETSVALTSDDNLLSLITTTVDGDTLTIASNESFSTELGMKVAITVPSLDGLQIRGAGDVHVEGVKGALFEATIQGSGDLVVVGTADRSVAEITGSGDIDFGDLHVKASEVSIAGSGNVRTYASESLKAQIRGSGDIGYLGHPKKIEPSILGSGDIKSLD